MSERLDRAHSADIDAMRDALTELKRIANELRNYNPAADEYKGKYIHKGWANKIDAALQAKGVAE